MKKDFYIKSRGIILNGEALEGLPLISETKILLIPLLFTILLAVQANSISQL